MDSRLPLIIRTSVLAASPLLFYLLIRRMSPKMVTNGPKKTVVVLGGGWNGTLAARQLSAQLDSTRYELVLINDRPYAIHFLSCARMTTTTVDDLDSEDKGLMPYDKLFHHGNGKVKIGTAVAVEEDSESKRGGWVVLEDGEKVRWDALVVATGCKWQGPLNFPRAEDVPTHIKEWRDRVKAADDIFVVGGGAVGIELAGEIKDAYPNKKVTVVHSGPMLLTGVYPEKYRKDIERRGGVRGINFAFEEYVDQIPAPGEKGLTTRKGTYFASADLVIPAFGSRPNTSFLQSLDSSIIAPNGSLKVDPTLQVRGHPSIFAIGDVVDWDEQKQAAKGGNHIKIVLPNVISQLEGKTTSKAYKGSPELIVIPLGKSGGSGYLSFLWGIFLGDWAVKTLKGKDLFVGQGRKDRGL